MSMKFYKDSNSQFCTALIWLLKGWFFFFNKKEEKVGSLFLLNPMCSSFASQGMSEKKKAMNEEKLNAYKTVYVLKWSLQTYFYKYFLHILRFFIIIIIIYIFVLGRSYNWLIVMEQLVGSSFPEQFGNYL